MENWSGQLKVKKEGKEKDGVRRECFLLKRILENF